MTSLEQYLNDHLTGSAAALSLLKALAAADPQHCEFYLVLRADIAENRRALLKVIDGLGLRRRRWREGLGLVTSIAGQMRLRWHGLSPGALGLMEALEVLELGIRGQSLLWMTLKHLYPTGLDSGVGLDELLYKAARQRAKVEEKRLLAASRAFARE